MDYILEQFDLDPLKDIENMSETYDFNNTWLRDTLYESSTSNKNIFEKVVDMIIGLLKWIGTAIGNIMKTIKEKFFGKSKSIDEIMQEVGVKPISAQKVTKSLQLKIYNKLKKENVKVEMDELIQPILVEINKNTDKITLDISKEYNLSLIEKASIQMGLALFKNSNLIYKMKDRCAAFLQNKSFILTNINHFLDDLNGIVTSIKGLRIETVEISMSDLEKMRSDIDELYQLIGKIFNVEEFKNNKKQFLNSLYTIQDFLLSMQHAMNYILASIQNTVNIDIKYFNTISDLETLSKFIEALYLNKADKNNIRKNTLLVFDVKKEFRVIDDAGVGRFAIFPLNKDVVYKCAYNKFGVISNKNENDLYNLSVKKNANLPLAKSISITSNHFIEEMEKIDDIGNDGVSPSELRNIENLFHNSKLLGPKKVVDLHAGNVLKDNKDNKIKVIDYGFISSKNRPKQNY